MIFISYSHLDAKKVMPIVDLITKEFGKEHVFLDIEKNGPGDDYWANIKIGLKTSQYFIMFNSVNYDESSACGNELNKAMNMLENIKIIEIKLDETPSHKLLIGQIYHKYNNSNETFTILKISIQNSSFSGFEIPKNINVIKREIIFDTKKWILHFKVSKKIINPIFAYSNPSEEIETSLFLSGTTMAKGQGLSVHKGGKALNFVLHQPQLTLYPGDEYKIILSDSPEEKILLFHLQELGSEINLNNYEEIYYKGKIIESSSENE